MVVQERRHLNIPSNISYTYLIRGRGVASSGKAGSAESFMSVGLASPADCSESRVGALENEREICQSKLRRRLAARGRTRMHAQWVAGGRVPVRVGSKLEVPVSPWAH